MVVVKRGGVIKVFPVSRRFVPVLSYQFKVPDPVPVKVTASFSQIIALEAIGVSGRMTVIVIELEPDAIMLVDTSATV